MPMTDEKLRDALLTCEATINKEASRLGITMAIRDSSADTETRRISHLLWMARQSLKLVEDNRREKAMRWLGFLQGALWAQKLMTIDQAKDMNRPEGSEHDSSRV